MNKMKKNYKIMIVLFWIFNMNKVYNNHNFIEEKLIFMKIQRNIFKMKNLKPYKP